MLVRIEIKCTAGQGETTAFYQVFMVDKEYIGDDMDDIFTMVRTFNRFAKNSAYYMRAIIE